MEKIKSHNQEVTRRCPGSISSVPLLPEPMFLVSGGAPEHVPVPTDHGQPRGPGGTWHRNSVRPRMSCLEFGTQGKNGILKHKEKPDPALIRVGGRAVPQPPPSAAPPPAGHGDVGMWGHGDMGTATAGLPGTAAPGARWMGTRSSVGVVAAVNRSEQRHYRFLVCAAVIRLSWGRGVSGCVSRKRDS